MACEICRKNNCTRVFHSLEEQEQFDIQYQTDYLKDRLKTEMERSANRLRGDYIGDEFYVKLSDVIDIIQSAG